MIDLDKLQKLSCLQVKDVHRQSIKDSLEGVMNMMHDIDKISVPLNLTLNELPVTEFEKDIVNSKILVKKDEKIEGLHLEDGFFLAPKVIQK